ncbi:MAG: pyrimidine dimer DNA glycosylase/endonuclease V [Deltaproteobacteria bacterium]|nr:pyrimidine dimer DNA glycosylase/endonuclease V [Deltaproteobacteria bacterium]
MRLWSLHPRHLDARGLVALWREGLVARAVLRGETRGYKHHPQLQRFLARRDPLAAIDCYLSRVWDEAHARGYRFDTSKIEYRRCRRGHAQVTDGQLKYEWKHFLAKLAVRDPARRRSERKRRPAAHPCFRVTAGPVADWERV